MSDISSKNLRQICVFPIPPIPYRRKERRWSGSPSVRGAKCFLSLSSCSLRPMKRALEFGFSESKVSLDVLPSFVLSVINVLLLSLLICVRHVHHQQHPVCVYVKG